MSKPSDSWYGSQDLSGEERDAKGTKAVWLQEGIVNHAAAALANQAGLLVVMDRCWLKEHAARSHRG